MDLDDFYEAGDNPIMGKDIVEVDEEMRFIWDEVLCPDEKRFILRVARNAYDYLTFFKVIKRISK